MQQNKLEVIIVGAPGTGKTQLRTAIIRDYPDIRVHTVQCSHENLDDDMTICGRRISWDDNE